MLPTIERNWIFTRAGGASTLNQTVPAVVTSTDRDQKLLNLWTFKDTLCNFAQGPWTVVQSKRANGTFGNADHWPAATALWDVANPSWIVLQNTFGGRQTQMLLYTDYYNGQVYIVMTTTEAMFPASVAGNAPVAPANCQKWDNSIGAALTTVSNIMGNQSYGIYRMNVAQTWDPVQGVESIRFSLFKAGSMCAWSFWDRLKDVVSGGPNVVDCPEVSGWCIVGSSSPYPNQSELQQSAYIHITHAATPTRIGAYMSTEMVQAGAWYAAALNGGAPSDVGGGGYHASPCGIFCNTAPLRGKLGNLVDWWIGSPAVGMGSTFPEAGPSYAQFGVIVWPWDPTQLGPQMT